MTETAELEEAVRERDAAEATLARVVTLCRDRLDMQIVQGPVSDLCRDILAITEEQQGRGRASDTNKWHHLNCGGLVMWDLSGGFCTRCHEEGLDLPDVEPDLNYIPSADE